MVLNGHGYTYRNLYRFVTRYVYHFAFLVGHVRHWRWWTFRTTTAAKKKAEKRSCYIKLQYLLFLFIISGEHNWIGVLLLSQWQRFGSSHFEGSEMLTNLKYIMFLIYKHYSMKISTLHINHYRIFVVAWFPNAYETRRSSVESLDSEPNGIYRKFELKGQKIIEEP